MTQKLIKLAFTIDKCCALSTIAKVSTYFPILMIGGRRVNAFFYVNYQKYRKLSQAGQRVKNREGKSQGRYFSQIFLGSQKYSQMAAYVCRLAISKVKNLNNVPFLCTSKKGNYSRGTLFKGGY